MQAESSKKWHVANWGLLGWLETVVKLVGIGAASVGFIDSLSADKFILGDNPHLAAVILLLVFMPGLVVLLYWRFVQKEIISMAYTVLNVLGHVALLLGLLRQPDQEIYAVIFGATYVIGELVKQRFLATTGYTEAGQSLKGMVNFSRFLTAVYLLLVILVLI